MYTNHVSFSINVYGGLIECSLVACAQTRFGYRKLKHSVSPQRPGGHGNSLVYPCTLSWELVPALSSGDKARRALRLWQKGMMVMVGPVITITEASRIKQALNTSQESTS
jgi:hypothetical protein